MRQCCRISCLLLLLLCCHDAEAREERQSMGEPVVMAPRASPVPLAPAPQILPIVSKVENRLSRYFFLRNLQSKTKPEKSDGFGGGKGSGGGGGDGKGPTAESPVSSPVSSPVDDETSNPTPRPAEEETSNPTPRPVAETTNPTPSPIDETSNPTPSPVDGETSNPTPSPVVDETSNPTPRPADDQTPEPTPSPFTATPTPTSPVDEPVTNMPSVPFPTVAPIDSPSATPLTPVPSQAPSPFPSLNMTGAILLFNVSVAMPTMTRSRRQLDFVTKEDVAKAMTAVLRAGTPYHIIQMNETQIRRQRRRQESSSQNVVLIYNEDESFVTPASVNADMSWWKHSVAYNCQNQSLTDAEISNVVNVSSTAVETAVASGDFLDILSSITSDVTGVAIPGDESEQPEEGESDEGDGSGPDVEDENTTPTFPDSVNVQSWDVRRCFGLALLCSTFTLTLILMITAIRRRQRLQEQEVWGIALGTDKDVAELLRVDWKPDQSLDEFRDEGSLKKGDIQQQVTSITACPSSAKVTSPSSGTS